MEPENMDGSEVLETTEVAEETTQETPTLSQEEITSLKEKAARADDLEEKNKKLFERAKKAEAKAPSKDTGDLSSKDVIFLAKADIHEEDLDTVLDWAKFKKISVADAAKEMKSVLDVKAEERRTAEAIHTKGGARGTAEVTGQDLLLEAQSKEISLDGGNAEKIFLARQARKIRKRN